MTLKERLKYVFIFTLMFFLIGGLIALLGILYWFPKFKKVSLEGPVELFQYDTHFVLEGALYAALAGALLGTIFPWLRKKGPNFVLVAFAGSSSLVAGIQWSLRIEDTPLGWFTFVYTLLVMGASAIGVMLFDGLGKEIAAVREARKQKR